MIWLLGGILLGCLTLRVALCLPQFKKKRRSKATRKEGKRNTMIYLGSGGHTTEMIALITKLDTNVYFPVHFVLGESDITSRPKIEASNLKQFNEKNTKWHTIPRAREVKQSWITTIFTTLWSMVHSVYLIFYVQPDLFICNGPGTCVPMAFAVFLLQLLNIKETNIVFVESFCRVNSLSLSGWNLYSYYIQRPY